MLIHKHDSDVSEARWREFVVAQGFGHFVASGRNREFAIIVPTQFVLTDTEIVAHFARPNPVFQALAENSKAVLSVAGDWAFIPGAWKAIAEENPAEGIPTTYYGAVQLCGTCTIVDEPSEIAAVLRTQLKTLDPQGQYIDPLAHKKDLTAIRGVRLKIENVQAKFKYGGNVDLAHRQAVKEHLKTRNGSGDAAALKHIQG